MNDEAVQTSHDRSSAKAHFHARLVRYRNLLCERWWVLLLGAAMGAAIGAGLAWYAPPSFVSVGRMIVSIKLAIQPASLYTEELSNFLGTQTALMQSGVVMNRAQARVMAQKPEVGLHPVELKVSVLPKTTIFVLKATGSDPECTQVFLQACMDEYIALKKEMRLQTSDTTVAGLTEQVARVERDLRKAEEDVLQFQRTNNVVLSQEQGNGSGNYIAALYQRLATLKSEYDLLQMLTLDQNLVRQQTGGGTSLPASPVPAGEGSATADDGRGAGMSGDGLAGGASDQKDADFLKAQQQLLLLKAEQQELGRYLRTNHPKMIAMKEEVGRREELLKIFRSQSEEQLKGRKQLLAIEIQVVERDLKAWDTKALELQQKTAEYQTLKANEQRTRTLYDQLVATMQTLDVNKEISPESVEIIEKASPAWPDRPKLLVTLAAGTLIGLVLGIGLLLMLDRLDDRVNSFTELQESFEEDVLGQIPRERSISSKKQGCLIQPEDARHSFIEAYRNLRSSLLYMGQTGERPKTILVTSSVPDDGKSVTAANLAITMASAGSRVLLVDADLRKGALHRLFGVPAGPGFSEVLSNGAAWEASAHATKFNNLFILPAGAAVTQSSELFIGEGTKKFLEDAVSRYDYVVLDTVPVMAADDVTSLAPQVDGVLFVIRSAFTSARVAHASLESLYQRQVRVLGLVFNAVRESSVDYYYYKYSDYYRPHPAAGAAPAEAERKGRV